MSSSDANRRSHGSDDVDTSSSAPTTTTSFEIYVKKETFKFNAAHFVAYPGFRERLHGHNYSAAVRLLGSRKIGRDGYVLDFGCVKSAVKDICKGLNEHFLCPMLSDVLKITVEENSEGDGSGTGSSSSNVRVECEDGSIFSFPRQDCTLLPIAHSTAEELGIYLYGKILQKLDAGYLLKRGIHTMEVTIAEAVGQEAVFRLPIPAERQRGTVEAGGSSDSVFDVANYITNGDLIPMPCPTDTEAAVGGNSSRGKRKRGHDSNGSCREKCGCGGQDFSKKLQAIADAINLGKLREKDRPSGEGVSVQDLLDVVET